MTTLRDGYNRSINYLRVSVTDRCNLRCLYCMPEQGISLKRHEDILRYEEIVRLVRVAAELGIVKVRLTGGEPLVRPGIAELVHMLAEVPDIDDLSLTTNGMLLASQAQALAAAGLKRVNVSLDSLRDERFHAITRRGRLADVLTGMRAAQEAGLTPVKINMVVIRGVNDDEVVDFAYRTLTDGWHVRFIEIMPLGEGAHCSGNGYVPTAEIRSTIEAALGSLEPGKQDMRGPARYWRLPGALGTIGFISPISEHFCHYCNRLRLTADGHLLPCLLTEGEIDVRTALRAGADDAVLRQLFLRAIAAKPVGHHLDEQAAPEGRLMAGIGG
ncbi:MAG: GTP 3',8-cyclase MoaA [Anaerolineae bacterium]